MISKSKKFVIMDPQAIVWVNDETKTLIDLDDEI